MGSEQQFCLRWHNYQSSLLASLPQLLDGDDLTDVTLMAGGCNLKAHRVVLSACSQYFKELFKVLQPLQHPVVVLPGAKFTDLCALVTFMYSGEVNIYQEQLQGLLSMADALQIRGLAEVNTNSGSSTNNDEAVLPKKDAVNPPVKRSRTSPQTSSVLSPNQTSEVTQVKRQSSPRQSATLDVPVCNRKSKQTENEIYSSMIKALGGTTSKSSIYETNPQFSNFKRNIGACSEILEPLTENTMKTVRNQTLKHSETNMFVEACLNASPTPSLRQDSEDNIQPIKVKIERDRHAPGIDSNISNELESALRSNKHSMDDVEMIAETMYGLQGDQSPSSNDSTLDNTNVASFNMDTESQRLHHLNQGQDLSKLASTSTSSSQYTKLWSSSIINNNKLSINSKLFATCFVCGKQLSNQYNLRVHMETHQNVNYACNVCNHVSRSRDALRKHVSYRHPVEAKDKGCNGGSSLEGHPVVGHETVARTKKSKLAANKDNNNNKRSHP